jgi:tRNA pseudouridine38-40 synthase
MTIVRLDLEYDGSGFSGWAAQPGLRTVEGELSQALVEVVGAPVELSVAGRTDAGVHAWGQVASFALDDDAPAGLAQRLNTLTGEDLTVVGAESAATDFDARRDAHARTYCYRLLRRSSPSSFERGRALWWPQPVDTEVLEACAAALAGDHDFTAFTPTQTQHVRFRRGVLSAQWRDGQIAAGAGDGRLLEFWIEADSFMRHMVRILVGTMLEVAGGRRKLDDFVALLDGAPRERAGDTAPAHGLYLASVSY